jgi:predicted dehydrogenase
VERNDMFMGVAREFLQLIEGSCSRATCTLVDGLKTLEVVEACRQSQRTGCEIDIAQYHD